MPPRWWSATLRRLALPATLPRAKNGLTPLMIAVVRTSTDKAAGSEMATHYHRTSSDSCQVSRLFMAAAFRCLSPADDYLFHLVYFQSSLTIDRDMAIAAESPYGPQHGILASMDLMLPRASATSFSCQPPLSSGKTFACLLFITFYLHFFYSSQLMEDTTKWY